jgi:hypothetical protein
MSSIINMVAQGLCAENCAFDWHDLTKAERDIWRNEARTAIIAFGLSKPELEELHAYRSGAHYDALMTGPRFVGWNIMQLNRARAMSEVNKVRIAEDVK